MPCGAELATPFYNCNQHDIVLYVLKLNKYLYLGWLIAYTQGSKHATNLQAHAGIMVTPGVNNALLPKAPINASVAYGVHAVNMVVVVVVAKTLQSHQGVCVYMYVCIHKMYTYMQCTRTYSTYVHTYYVKCMWAMGDITRFY